MAESDIFVSNDISMDVNFGEVFVIDQGVVYKVIARKYSSEQTYVVGEYVLHLEKLYRCITAIETAEEFDAEKWTQVLLADEVQIANANIALKANASDVYAKSETYNKTEVNTALAGKADANTTYSKTEVDTALASKADTATTYTKTEVDTALGDKADKSDTYTKTEVDTALSAKANSDDVYAKTDTYSKDEIDTNIYTKSETYNKNEVDGIINNLPAPMIFKGTLGVNGTITTLPTASSDNEGFTYKVITDGTYASISAKVGDMFTSNGAAWVHIPSGDETFTDTWRSIKVNGTEKLTGSITSGSVDFKNGTNSTAVFDPSDNSIKINIDGYTQSQIDTKLSAKANSSDVYTKSQTYTKTEVNTALNNKADKSTTYTKTEVDTALGNKADKSDTYTKAEVDARDELVSSAGPSAIANFNTELAVDLVDCKTTLTPSLVGYTEVNITVADSEMTPVDTYAIALGGTYYGGTLDVTTGVLTVTHKRVDLGSLTWALWTGDSSGHTFVTTLNDRKYDTYNAVVSSPLSILESTASAWITILTYDKKVFLPYNNSVSLLIRDEDYSDKGVFKTAMSGKYLTYELATPVTVQLTPTAVTARAGDNNVYSDTGDTSVQFINSNAEDTVTVMQTVGGAPIHNYSTNEQIVGTWIDGSIVYEKTIYDAGGTYGSIGIEHGISNFGHCISAIGTAYDIGYKEGSQRIGAGDVPFPRVASDNNNIGVIGVNTIYVNVNVPSAFNDRIIDIYITLRYTKSSS